MVLSMSDEFGGGVIILKYFGDSYLFRYELMCSIVDFVLFL